MQVIFAHPCYVFYTGLVHFMSFLLSQPRVWDTEENRNAPF